MRVLKVAMLWHSGAANNLGLGALTWSNIVLTQRAAADAGVPVQITLLVTGEPRFDRIDPLGGDVRALQVTVPTRATWIPSAYLRLRAAIADADLVMDIGAGDSFASIYGTGALFRQLFTKATAAAARPSLVLAPQTLGPFTHAGMLACRPIIARSDIVFCRDKTSQALARSMRHRRVEAVADVAFALEPRTTTNLKSGGTRIGINVSGLLYRATPGDRYYVPGYRELISAALEALMGRDATDVYLIPHVVSLGGEGVKQDYDVAAELSSCHRGVILPEPFLTPGEAKGYIAQLDALITSRLHASIAAVGSGVPAIAIAYSPKFVDTLGFVGYQVPTIKSAIGRSRQGAGQIHQAIEDLPRLRRSAHEARARAAQSLSRYQNMLAEHLSVLAEKKWVE